MASISILNPKTKLDRQLQMGLIALLSVVVIWYVWSNFVKDQKWKSTFNRSSGNQNSTSNNTPAPPSNNSSDPSTGEWVNKTCNNFTTLERYVVCDKVEELQQFINEKVVPKTSFSPLLEDGYFGELTEEIVEHVTGGKSTYLSGFRYLVNLNPIYS